MVRLSPEICLKIKEARRAAKFSQSEVAAEVGCKQSALSMFENGDGTKLNAEVINRLSKKFGISLESEATDVKPVPVMLPQPEQVVMRGFCPNAHCPSNQAYEIDGRTFVRPNRVVADPVGGRFCALCGEVLEKHCPNCGAPVHDGAICSLCGEPYVAVI